MHHGMLVREESPRDYKEIHRLVKTAFETARVRDGDEQDYVDRLRAGDGYVPELALVACEENKLVGHIMLTRLALKTDGERRVKTLLLAPLAVLKDYRSQGVGAALVAEALRRAKAMGYEGVVLAGDPAYYRRFGFKAASAYGITYTGPIPPENLLAMELKKGVLERGDVDIGVHQ